MGFSAFGRPLSGDVLFMLSSTRGLAKHAFSWARIHDGLLGGNMEWLVHGSGVGCLSMKDKDFE